MNPIKQFSRTWASSNCSSCFMNTDCVRASAFGYDKRKYALVSKGFRQKPTLAMLKGTEMHEQLASEYPPLDIADIRKGIKQGKKVILAEQGFCNVNFGMRCHCDLVEIQLIEDKMKIKITDYKTSFWPTQLFQVTVEGMIFSSRNCKIIIEEDGKKKKKA